MGHREVQYRGLWDIEGAIWGLWDIGRCNIGDYGT